ncbi:MAG: hypothetical protein EOM24_15555 [Chloroflexia bacterium]|nr:hypothetical protein [Chloroflexia bacterium]
MEKRSYSYTQLGMLIGTCIGSGLSVLLLSNTGNAVYLIIAGAGTAMGLVLGAGIDKYQKS